MNLFDLNTNTITMNIDGKDIEMKHPICFGKVYNKWLVSRCGIVWSLTESRPMTGRVSYTSPYNSYSISTKRGFWEDGSGRRRSDRVNRETRDITGHKMVMDTWASLYDNPPEGIVWEEWEIVRKLPSVYNHISKTVVIDHIDDNKQNNHLDNLRRVTPWDNQKDRKAKGI